MDFLVNLWKSIKSTFSSDKPTQTAKPSSGKTITFPKSPQKANPNEIRYGAKTDEQLQAEAMRSKYITLKKNPNYTIHKGENIGAIAKKFGVEEATLLDYNGLTKETATKIPVGKSLKIPPTKIVKNVKNLKDAANALGVNVQFVKEIKKLEACKTLGENQFHNTPYPDVPGVYSIGIGHVVTPDTPKYLSNAQVCETFTKDMLKVEENLISLLGGKSKYDKLPQPIKAALLDMGFNKGTEIFKNTPGLLYTLKVGKYEAAINKMTYCKSNVTGKEMSGLCKRRIFDISVATQMYKGKIPQSNINTAQYLYDKGVQILRKEYPDQKTFVNVLAGFNKDVSSYMHNKIKLVTK